MNTKNRIFLLLGGNKLNYGMLSKFKKNGYLVYVIDWNESPNIIGDRHYQIDVKDADKIIDTLKCDGVWEKVAFAYSSIDLAVPSVAKINKAIGLSVISKEGLKYSSSKSMMTKRWGEKGLLNRISKVYVKYDKEIEKISNEMNLIVKPDNSASSRGITIIKQGSEGKDILIAFDKAKKEASNNLVVVEEFVDGIEFTVEMIGDAHGNVSVYGISEKRHTKNAKNNKIAVKLHYNSISLKLQKEIASFAISCYRALGFSSSLGHLEIILKKNGTLSPVEIGARSSGFIASDLVDIVSGADFIKDLIAVQKGGFIPNGLHQQTNKTSMYFFYDLPSGKKIIRKCNILDYCDDCIISRHSDTSKIIVGNTTGLLDNDNERMGVEILEGPKDVMTAEYIYEAERRMIKDMLGE